MKEINYQEKQQQNHLNAFLKVVDPTFIKYYQKIRKKELKLNSKELNIGSVKVLNQL